MGKKGKKQRRSAEHKVDYPYPSRYGSHQSMVDATRTVELMLEGWVICTDDNGKYATERKKLDNGLADPNRYASKEGRKKIRKQLKDDEEKSN